MNRKETVSTRRVIDIRNSHGRQDRTNSLIGWLSSSSPDIDAMNLSPCCLCGDHKCKNIFDRIAFSLRDRRLIQIDWRRQINGIGSGTGPQQVLLFDLPINRIPAFIGR